MDPAELLRLAVAEPRIAGARADALLATSTDPWTLSVARHVRGLVLREQGRLAEAVSELRSARSGWRGAARTRTVSPTSGRRWAPR